jgi:Secretion system C-terminal sorting domain
VTNVLQNGTVITWSASTDDNIVGYHVYRAYNEFGKFERVTPNPITSLSFIDTELTAVVRYFVIKAIKLETTGSGTYLNPSIGVAPTINLKNDNFELANLKIFPNPASNFLEVSSSEKIDSYQIIDLQGKVILSDDFSTNKIDITNLNSGIYFIKVRSKEKTNVRKFIKN